MAAAKHVIYKAFCSDNDSVWSLLSAPRIASDTCVVLIIHTMVTILFPYHSNEQWRKRISKHMSYKHLESTSCWPPLWYGDVLLLSTHMSVTMTTITYQNNGANRSPEETVTENSETSNHLQDISVMLLWCNALTHKCYGQWIASNSQCSVW